jgi:SAM-dependent MidA family methyltransferase
VWEELRVGCDGACFAWVAGPPLGGEALELALEHATPFDAERKLWMELPVRLEQEMARIAAALERGYVLAIDYGYTPREALRFPRGTLMGYRRHRASEAVLEDPGAADITAHVPFALLERAASRHGLRLARKERLAQLLLRAGEGDAFAAALAAPDERAALRLRMQLKTLLFGMGESFDALLFETAPKR